MKNGIDYPAQSASFGRLARVGVCFVEKTQSLHVELWTAQQHCKRYLFSINGIRSPTATDPWPAQMVVYELIDQPLIKDIQESHFTKDQLEFLADDDQVLVALTAYSGDAEFTLDGCWEKGRFVSSQAGLGCERPAFKELFCYRPAAVA